MAKTTKGASPADDLALGFMTVPLDSLHPHPRNYRKHPPDEIEHIKSMIREHKIYRNVVTARDGTLLAGHGVVEAARQLELIEMPIFRTPYEPDDPRALQILAGDNYIAHLAEDDDRALSELLKELKDVDMLLGTGYDEMMLANLVTVTRTAEEIPDINVAAQWVGMPEYQDKGEDQIQLTVHFVNEEDQAEFCRLLGITSDDIQKRNTARFIWWPRPQERVDAASVCFTDDFAEEDEEDYG